VSQYKNFWGITKQGNKKAVSILWPSQSMREKNAFFTILPINIVKTDSIRIFQIRILFCEKTVWNIMMQTI
jgi:hypothetical protein